MTHDKLSATFAALADSTRRGILARLSSGEATVTELAAPFDMSMPAITKHLKVLERSGLISRGRKSRWRPCRMTPEPLKEVAVWTEQYRVFWDQSFDKLDELLREINTKNKETYHANKKR